ncbi:MAG: TetR/AcrR family transcriptional regulator [Bacteroidia bacterium]|nr:MAG: TetR/AcrR family transcriptional regulator [Bacteroidia bacterium]
MSPRTKQQFENIRVERKSHIMNAALELFAMEGYHNTSIHKIAVKAGISKGLMYNYFDNKEDLIRTIIIDGLDRLVDLLDPNRDGSITKEELKLFIELSFEMMRKDLHFWTLYFSLMTQPQVLNLVHDKLEETLLLYQAMLGKYFEMLNYEDPETEALIFGALMDGIGLNFIANPDLFPMEKIKNRLIQLYC